VIKGRKELELTKFWRRLGVENCNSFDENQGHLFNFFKKFQSTFRQFILGCQDLTSFHVKFLKVARHFFDSLFVQLGWTRLQLLFDVRSKFLVIECTYELPVDVIQAFTPSVPEKWSNVWLKLCFVKIHFEILAIHFFFPNFIC